MCVSKQLLSLFAADVKIFNMIHRSIFVSPSFEARTFFSKFTVKFTPSLWHIIGKKTQNYMKIQHKYVKSYKTAHMFTKNFQ
jgi:hypothetical protein